MKVQFEVTSGINTIDIPLDNLLNNRAQLNCEGVTDLWARKVTIYNDIPADAVNDRRYTRHVIERCNIQGGIISKADGTIENIINAVSVITRDVEHYRSPAEYRAIPIDLSANVYTVQIGDFVVLEEVDDIVTTSREFAQLQQKYANNGFVVRTVSAYINGMNVDNVQFANVG